MSGISKIKEVGNQLLSSNDTSDVLDGKEILILTEAIDDSNLSILERVKELEYNVQELEYNISNFENDSIYFLEKDVRDIRYDIERIEERLEELSMKFDKEQKHES